MFEDDKIDTTTALTAKEKAITDFATNHDWEYLKSQIGIISNGADTKDALLRYKKWFALFIAPKLVKDVADQVALIRAINNVEIYPWNADDFVEYSADNNFDSIQEYKIIRDYMKPQQL